MKPKQRIGTFTAFALIGVAVLLDALQFLFSFLNVIPVAGNAAAFVLNWFIAILAAITFGLWFFLLGVDYFQGKRAGLKLLALFGSLVIELIPIIDALPAITAGVLVTITVAALEDKELVPKTLASPRKIYRRFQNQERIERQSGVRAQPSVVPTHSSESE